jgi:hypothetical protein
MAAWKLKWMSTNKGIFLWWIRVITKKLPNSEQTSKGTYSRHFMSLWSASNTSQSLPTCHLILNVRAGRLSCSYFFLHEYAVSLSLAARAPEKTPAYKSLLAINQHNRKIISYKFRNVHAVRCIPWQIGVFVSGCLASQTSRGNQYTADISCHCGQHRTPASPYPQRNFFMMNKGNNKKITELRTNVQRDFRGELSNRNKIRFMLNQFNIL